ncbi:MAG: serine/threonine protein kinase [Actinobacteria bacterium]|nr:serine/threonine protein kinase [Actinomycetota bacterium]
MGIVYKAIQETEHLSRTVALKLLLPELSQDPKFRMRFMRESRLAAELNHPNIIPIYDADEAGGQLLLAMPLIDGEDLSTVIDREGPLDPERVFSILRQAGAALDKAHAEGLVHRDVKPGNILLSQNAGDEGSEHVYLCDFGLTKRTSSQSGLTAAGHWLGTLEYMAPEQIDGRSVTGASDIYALGCVLFECLTGKAPFVRESDLALLHAHMTEEPPLVTEHRPDLPTSINEVVQRAMAKEPEERFESCRALALASRPALIRPVERSKPGGSRVQDEATRAPKSASPHRKHPRHARPRIVMAIALTVGALICLALGYIGLNLLLDAIA